MTPHALDPEKQAQARQRLYDEGHAAGMLSKMAGDAQSVYALSGRLVRSKSGWGLLEVPNSLVRGLFAALDVPGAELPPSGPGGQLDAHISVFTKGELIGLGPDRVTEFGKRFKYQIGPIQEVAPKGWEEMAKCWFARIISPELKKLRVSYGLTPLPHGDHDFHVSIAVRRKGVLQAGPTAKAAEANPRLVGFLSGLKVAAASTSTLPDGRVLDIDALNGLAKSRRVEKIPLDDIAKPSRSSQTGYSNQRLGKVDMTKPVLVGTDGTLFDGRHRLVRHIDEGHSHIRARRVTDDDLASVTLETLRSTSKPVGDKIDASRVELLPAKAAATALPAYTIDRPRGYEKTFPTPNGPVKKTYPVDYGYFNDYINPDDNEGLDVFVGTGKRHGRFMKGKNLTGVWQPDERKWYAGLSDDELGSVKDLFESQSPGLLRDFQSFRSPASLVRDISQYKTQATGLSKGAGDATGRIGDALGRASDGTGQAQLDIPTGTTQSLHDGALRSVMGLAVPALLPSAGPPRSVLSVATAPGQPSATAAQTMAKHGESVDTPIGEFCPKCQSRQEHDTYSGTCNSCGEKWGYFCETCHYKDRTKNDKCPKCSGDMVHDTEANRKKYWPDYRTKKSDWTPALAGAGIGALGGIAVDHLSNKRKHRDPLSAAIAGGLFGGGLGALAGGLARADDNRERLQDSPGVEFKETLKHRIEPYYENAPGGVTGAIDRAIAARESVHGGPQLAFTAKDLDTPIDIKSVPLRAMPGDATVKYDGMTYKPKFQHLGGKPHVYVSDTPDPGTLDHELTHAALDHIPWIRGGPKNDYEPADGGNYKAYVQSPAELIPRVAGIKRRYVAAHPGQDVSDPVSAGMALDWWRTQMGDPDFRIKVDEPKGGGWDAWDTENPKGSDFWERIKKLMPQLVAHDNGQHAKIAASLTADEEWEQIKKRRETPEAQKPHKFQQAHWTHKNGHPRCKVCGDEPRGDGTGSPYDLCDGYAPNRHRPMLDAAISTRERRIAKHDKRVATAHNPKIRAFGREHGIDVSPILLPIKSAAGIGQDVDPANMTPFSSRPAPQPTFFGNADPDVRGDAMLGEQPTPDRLAQLRLWYQQHGIDPGTINYGRGFGGPDATTAASPASSAHPNLYMDDGITGIIGSGGDAMKLSCVGDAWELRQWQAVPRMIVEAYAKAAAVAALVRDAYGTTEAIYWQPTTCDVHVGSKPDDSWLLIKRAEHEAFAKPVADSFATAQRPLGGPHPLAASVVGGLLGAGLGYGGGALAERILPRQFERGRLRKTLGILGGVVGTLPGVGWGAVNMANPDRTGGPLQAWTSGWPFKQADEKCADTGALYTPSIPVDAFNNAIWSDVQQPQNPYGTKSMWGDNSQPLQTPPWAAAAASGIITGTGAATGQQAVSPFQIGMTAAATAGKGYLAGLVFGKTLGALAGLRPESQQMLQDAGLWGGLVTGAVHSLFNGND